MDDPDHHFGNGSVWSWTQTRSDGPELMLTRLSSQEEKEKWIKHYVERKTAGTRNSVEDAEAAVQQEQEDTRKAENVGLRNREPERLLNR
jgi:hypothetical protein